jgi:hypothetical protein
MTRELKGTEPDIFENSGGNYVVLDSQAPSETA